MVIKIQSTDDCVIENNALSNCETAIDVSISDHIILVNNHIGRRIINFRKY